MHRVSSKFSTVNKLFTVLARNWLEKDLSKVIMKVSNLLITPVPDGLFFELFTLDIFMFFSTECIFLISYNCKMIELSDMRQNLLSRDCKIVKITERYFVVMAFLALIEL